MTVVRAHDLTVLLRGRRVLDQVSLELTAGGLVGLIGPNGAGKTTLVRALAGLQRLAAGRVEIGGRPLPAWSRQALARTLAYLPQTEGVHWDVTVEVLVTLGRLPHRHPWRRAGEAERLAVERALRATDMTSFRSRPVGQLSGGERARALLARALAGEPEVLLADEPVANLDPYHQLEVMEYLRDLARAGTAVLVVLHDLTLATRFCDRLVLLHEGRLAASGDAATVTAARHLSTCFRIEAHRGRIKGGDYVIPIARVGPPAAAPPERIA